MLARLAENLLWAGRYLERAEDTARMLDVTYHGLLESPSADAEHAWRSLLASLGQQETYEATGAAFAEGPVTAFLVTDRSNPGSVASAVHVVRENVRSLRERVSAELWEAINSFHLELGARDLDRDLQMQRYHVYSLVKQRCQTIAGVADQTMPRDDGWLFFSIGRQLERAAMGARLLDVYFRDLPDDEEIEYHYWKNLLRAASAFEAYTRSRSASMDPQDAVDYLLLDQEHPRSILFCLRSAESELGQLDSPGAARPSLRAAGRARSLLEFSDPTERRIPNQGSFVQGLILDVQAIIDAITAEFFAPARPGAMHSFDVA